MPTIPISHLDTSAVDIKHSESAYNQTVISPIFKSIARQLYTEYGTVWFPGEEKLNSLFDQLKLIHPDIDKRHGYNADSVLRVRSHSNLEVFIAEVSSRFMQTDKSKHSTDHHKGMFGLLSMAKAIADNYKHATLATFQDQKVFFLQAYNDSLYLWSLKCVESNLYCPFRERKVRAPYSFANRMDNVLYFILFVNEIKVYIAQSHENVFNIPNNQLAG